MSTRLPRSQLAALLKALHARYHRREFVSPDPLELLYGYEQPDDREIAGLVASSLAFGNVKAIVGAARRVLQALGPHPADCLMKVRLPGFRYRWISGGDMENLLHAAASLRAEAGSLGSALFVLVQDAGGELVNGLASWRSALVRHGMNPRNRLVPDPAAGGAAKRLFLYLRWMVRCDGIDPGGWKGLRPAQLVVPLDVHMQRIGRALGLLRRATPDMKAALELTAGFRRICPEDPVRYDFCLTRMPLHDRMDTRAIRRALSAVVP